MELEVKRFDAPDEVRPFIDCGRSELVRVGGRTVMLSTYEPGWRWSEHVRPIAGTRSCQALHVGYVLAGRMRVRTDAGEAGDVGPGDVFCVPPGHDGETLGGEPCVFIDFGQLDDYAKERSES